MKMKQIIVLLLLLTIKFTAFSQEMIDFYSITKAKNKNDSVLINCVLPELTIIRQQYCLQQGNDLYGKNNMPYYGETYTLGIKVAGGTIFQNRVVAPWIGDEDYQRANKTGKYKPVYFGSYLRALNDSVFTDTDLEFGTKFVEPVDKDSLIYLHTDSYSDFGLEIDESAGEKKGYLIWAYSDTNVQDSAMTVTLKQSAFRTHTDSVCLKIQPVDAERIIGGLYVVPRYTRGGHIQLLLAGVASKAADNSWRLRLMAESKTSAEAAEPSETSSVEPTKIGKVDKKNKKK